MSNIEKKLNDDSVFPSNINKLRARVHTEQLNRHNDRQMQKCEKNWKQQASNL